MKQPSRGNKKYSLLPIAVSALILAVLIYKTDWAAFARHFTRLHTEYIWWLLLSFVAFFFIGSLRWSLIVSAYHRLPLWESFRQVAAGCALNILIPAKLGSLAKALFLARGQGVEGDLAGAMAFYEKFADFFGFFFLFCLAYVIEPHPEPLLVPFFAGSCLFVLLYMAAHFLRKVPESVRRREKASGLWAKLYRWLGLLVLYFRLENVGWGLKLKLNLLTVAMWLIHAWQMVLFFRLIGLEAPAAVVVTGMFGAIFVGVLPISMAGLGTREAAIYYIFRGSISLDAAMALGALFLTRYFVPALVGLPFMGLLRYCLPGKKDSKPVDE